MKLFGFLPAIYYSLVLPYICCKRQWKSLEQCGYGNNCSHPSRLIASLVYFQEVTLKAVLQKSGVILWVKRKAADWERQVSNYGCSRKAERPRQEHLLCVLACYILLPISSIISIRFRCWVWRNSLLLLRKHLHRHRAPYRNLWTS